MHEKLQLDVGDVAFGGAGVARHGGKVVFVPFTIAGEKVTAHLVREKKKFAEADLISVDHASPHRVTPRCPYFGRCGGCAYQHIVYSEQLALKSRQVLQTLQRLGRINEVPMRPIVASPEEYEYRNRIRVHVRDGVSGFYAHRSRILIDIEHCPISRPVVNEALTNLRRAALRDGDYSLRAPGGGGPFFEQTNPEVARKMVHLVESLIQHGQVLLVDAYCGGGLFAKHLAPRFERVIGIDESIYAIEAARRGAGVNETYIAGEVSQHLGEILTANEPRRTTVIVDPPAAGVTARVLDLLVGTGPAEVVYVSCNPATLARDLSVLCRTYHLESVTPVDMFPQTAEIEVVAHLRRAA